MNREPREIIRIDADVWAAIKRLAGKFETPNGVLRRALGLAEKSGKKPRNCRKRA